MKIRSVELETVAGLKSVFPENALPEFAFWGRSNVGKSSLLNALIGRKSYARISAEPGKTATVNYYNVNKALYLVDLPGYGYAKVSEKTREAWKKMTERYLLSSRSLKKVFLLLDIRHEFSANDRETLAWLAEKGIPVVPVFTKADKLSKTERQKMEKRLTGLLPAAMKAERLTVSAEKKEGIDGVWTAIEAELAPAAPAEPETKAETAPETDPEI